jgi:hypothetical protein
MTQTREAILKLLQEQASTQPISQIGGMDFDGQQKALRIYQKVAFPTPNFFPPSKPRSLPRTGLVLIDWLSIIAVLGSGSRPIWVRNSRRKRVIACSQVPSRFQRRK